MKSSNLKFFTLKFDPDLNQIKTQLTITRDHYLAILSYPPALFSCKKANTQPQTQYLRRWH